MSDEGTIDVIGLDHLVLRVADVERSLAWYCDVLGLAPVRVDEWRGGTVPFPSVRVDVGTIIDLIGGGEHVADGPGRLDHLCLVVEPGGVDTIVARAASGAFTIVDGPGTRFGARGNGTSVYVLDPDGITVELRSYEHLTD